MTSNQEILLKCKNYYYGINGVRKDYKEGAKYAKILADNGHLAGMNIYGTLLEFGDGVKKDLNLAKEYYTRAAKEDYCPAMFNLANYYLKYDKCSSNKAEILDLLTRSTNKDHESSAKVLGKMYETADMVDLDFEKAAQYNKIAADKGNVESILKYAKLLANGNVLNMNRNIRRDVPKNDARSWSWGKFFYP